MRKYLIFIGIGLIILTSFFIGFNPEKEPLLIVRAELPPFEYYKNDSLVGIHVEITEKILSELKIPYEIQLMDFDSALRTLSFGEADMMFSVLHSKSRESYVDYTDEMISYKTGDPFPETTLWIEQYALFHQSSKKDELDLSSIEAIRNNNYRVGLIDGYVYPDDLTSQNLNFYSFLTVEDSIKGLNKGEVDILISDVFPSESTIKSFGLEDEIQSSYNIFYYSPNYIVFSKNSKYKNLKKVKEMFYKELIRLKEEENLHNILYKKYLNITFDEAYNKLIY